MLFDPRWQGKATDVYSLASIIQWLESKDPKETYDWCNVAGGCLLHQYLIDMGCDWKHDYGKIPTSIRSFVAMRVPWTVGEALARARELASDFDSVVRSRSV